MADTIYYLIGGHMSIVFPATNIFARIFTYLSPPDRPIARYSTAQHLEQMRSTPIDMRSLGQQQVAESNGRVLRRASEPVSFEIRFQLLVLFIRQKCTGSIGGLKDLEADVQALKESVAKTDCHAAYKILQSMSDSLNRKITSKEAASRPAQAKAPTGYIPKTDGPIYGGW